MENISARLNEVSIGVAGAGGLGSNAAIALIRAGVQNIVIADYDNVEKSNLNRQYFFADQIGMPKVEALKINALRINPDCNITTHCVKITPDNAVELFSGCDLIIEALDNADQKIMLIETLMEQLPDLPIVAGSGMGGWGKSVEIQCKQLGNVVLCGDFETEVNEEHPPLAPRVGIVANMQANEALRILLEGSKIIM
jgi:sulfur carrier protein ThiS adenylyltransferase